MWVLKSLVGALLQLAAIGALAGLVAGAKPSLHPAADSFAHFRLHFAFVLILALAPLAVFWFRGWMCWTAIALCAVTVLGVRSVWFSGPPETTPAAEMRLVQFNLSFRNQHMRDVMAYIAETDPDFVTLQEVTESHQAYLDLASATHPYRRVCPFPRIGAVVILSKHPAIEADSGCERELGLTWLRAETPKGPVTVASLHLHWPWPFDQHRQIDRVAPMLAELKMPLIIGGDFNAAPWSHAVERVAEAARAEPVPGLRATIRVKPYPRLPAVPIPIDHVLVSDELCGLAARTGPRLGSDHSPVIVDIGWFEPGASTGCAQLR